MYMGQQKFCVEHFGPGKPAFSIVVGVHGDEKAPLRGAQRIRELLSRTQAQVGFQIVTANLPAIKRNTRFIQKDLNRSFPGTENARGVPGLAHELTRVLASTPWTFDFHSNIVSSPVYGVMSVYSDARHSMLQDLGVKNTLIEKAESLIKYVPNGIAFEVGAEKDEESPERAFRLMKNVLQRFSVIKPLAQRKSAHKNTQADLFMIYRLINITALRVSDKLRDFKQIQEGDIIGWMPNNTPVYAQERFYPILVNHPTHIRAAKRILIYE